MNRGRRGEKIFEDKDDYTAFIALLKEIVETYNVRISAYSLMQNHYHLLVQTPDGNISRSMRHLNGVYTQRFNRTHHYDGQLFRGRYKSILVEGDSYLLELVRYIHRNPLEAGLVGITGQEQGQNHHFN
jgi:putative transposase